MIAVRVVHVITRGDVGGAQTHVVELAMAQSQAGLDVIAVAGTDGPALAKLRNAGIDVHVVPSLGQARNRLWQRAAVDDLRVLLADLAPNVVHSHSSNAGFATRLAARRIGAVSVYTAHGWPFQRGAPWSQRSVSLVGEIVGGRLGDGVICLTEAELMRARRARVAPPSKLWIVPNGIGDVTEDLIRRPDPSRAMAIVMVARFAPPKLQRGLIDALTPLVDLDWSMTFVGDGPEFEACRTYGIERLGNRVEFVGHRDDVAQILARSDVCVLWSRYEGLPMSLMEAMRAGLCCVASDLPGVRFLFGEPPCGIVARDQQRLTQTLRRLAGNEGRTEINACAEAARSRFVQRFSASSMEVATRNVYDALLAQRASA